MISLLILFFTVSLLFSFLCSLWEAVLLSITPSYAAMQESEGTPLGSHLREFKQNIDKPLAAILTLNTIAHTVGAIGVGNQAAAIWAESSPMLTMFVIPAGMTIAILVLSEIIPKTLGANHWKRLAPFTVACLLWLGRLLWPLVWLSQHITRALKSDKNAAVLTRSDFVAMAQLGAQEGVLKDSESTIIANLLRFSRVVARDVMTPRTVVHAASESETLQAFYDASKPLRFSRIPCHEADNRDHVTGYFLKDDLLEALVHGRADEPLTVLRRRIIICAEDEPIPKLLSEFLAKREHIAIVVDPFGGMCGVVTIEDVIETLLGLEIVDESDSTADMQKHARQLWERRAGRLSETDQALGAEGNPD